MLKGRIGSLSAIGALTLTVFCWGLVPVANRYLLTRIQPQHLLLLRFVVASALFLAAYLSGRRDKWTRPDLLLALFCGIAYIIGYNVSVTYGVQYISAGTAGLLLATNPLWIVLIASVVFHERPHWPVFVGLGIALAGVVTLLGGALFTTSINAMALLGMGLTLLATLMFAIYTVTIRPLNRRYGTLQCTALTTIFGTVPLFALGDAHLLTSVSTFNLAAWSSFLLLAVGSTVVGSILWNYGVAHLSSTQAGMFLYLLPFVSVIGGVLFLDEHLTPGTLLSGLLIIAGVIIAQFPSLKFFSHQYTS